VYVPNWGVKGNIAYSVGLTLLQNLNAVKSVSQVWEDNRLSLQGISWSK